MVFAKGGVLYSIQERRDTKKIRDQLIVAVPLVHIEKAFTA